MSVNKIALRITNSTNNAMTMHLEPWGEERNMKSGTTLKIEAQGPGDGTLEVEYGENTITVYGWSGSTVCVSEIMSDKKDLLFTT